MQSLRNRHRMPRMHKVRPSGLMGAVRLALAGVLTCKTADLQRFVTIIRRRAPNAVRRMRSFPPILQRVWAMNVLARINHAPGHIF